MIYRVGRGLWVAADGSHPLLAFIIKIAAIALRKWCLVEDTEKNLPRIVEVSADRKPLALRVRWDNGEVSLIDVSGVVGAFRVYAPLRDTPDLFRQVTVGELGADVVWPNGADMAADTLWRLAREQTGLTMTPDAFRIWRERKACTLETAAKA